MQPVSAEYLSLLSGSHTPVVWADAWWAGRCVYPRLPIADGTIQYSSGGNVRATLNLTVRSLDPELVPRAAGVLSPFGGEVVVRAGIRRGPIVETVQLGRFLVQEAETSGTWKAYQALSGDMVMVPRGGETQLTAMDRMALVKDTAFVSRAQPTQSTVLQECRRILTGVAPWKPPAGVADKPLAAGAVTYSQDRAAALTDLAALLDCEPYANPQGVITLARKTPPLTSVWTVPRGVGGQLVGMTRRLARTGMTNAVIAQGTAFTGAPLRGVAYESNPALRWGGPFGRVPTFVDAPLASNQADVDQVARTELATQQRQRWQEITVSIVTNYALEVGDVITVPTARGSITGPVTGFSVPLKPTATMDVTMTVDPFVLAQVS